MRLALDELDARPITWLCRRVGSARFAAVATTAIGAGMEAGMVDAGAAAGCLAVAMVVTADRVHDLASRRNDKPGARPLAVVLGRMLDAARGEGDERFWLVRHAAGRTEAMTPSAFARFSNALARRLQRVLMVFPDREPVTNLGIAMPVPGSPGSTADAPAGGRGRNGAREASMERQAALSRLTGKPMPCVFVGVWDDVQVIEMPALVDLATGILSPLVMPAEAKGPLTESYVAFDGGGEHRIDRLADGRFAVLDMPALVHDLTPAAAAM